MISYDLGAATTTRQQITIRKQEKSYIPVSTWTWTAIALFKQLLVGIWKRG
ncbi:MAG: hypothetical protein ACLU30_04930 [Odoribacter splanchnicus]